MAHERQYANIVASFLWQTARPPHQLHQPGARKLLGDGDRHEAGSAGTSLKTHVLDLYRLATFFLGLPLTLCMLAFARPLWRDPAARGAVLLLGTFYLGAAFNLRLFPHYAAPATILSYILAAAAIRAVRRAWPGSADERILVPWAVLAAFTAITLAGLLTANNRYLFGPIDYHVRAEWASVTERLQQTPGDHLVLVSYGPKHEIYQELVYNQADIDRSRVIWARSLSLESDRQLVEHYAGRRIWTLTENGELLLKSYGEGQEESTMATQVRAVRRGHF